MNGFPAFERKLMSRSNPKTIGITLGDPAGIGPEVIARALDRRITSRKAIKYVLIGNEAVFARFWPPRKPWPSFMVMGKKGVIHVSGKPTLASGNDSLLFLGNDIKSDTPYP